jgi:hypothetical protein
MYYSTYNFVGDRIAGYEEPYALLTKEAAEALKEVSDDLASQGYRLKIYDAYRPQMAVTNFVEWAEDMDDTRMKEYFYPELEKEGHWQRTLEHLHEKYYYGGYLKLWIPESPNAGRLEELRRIIADEPRLRQIFERIWEEESVS